jgi:predicted lipoprotein with Yx(FWY)xxD motif
VVGGRRRLTGIVVLAAALLVALPTGAGTKATRAVVKTAYNKKLKRTIVVDGSGRALYMFTADVGGKPACTPQTLGASCVHQWPPLKSKRKPTAGKGIDAKKLAVVTRSDKIKQAVYNHHPLYHYIGDDKPGDVYGQNYLGAWYVLSPAGKPIKKKP